MKTFRLCLAAFAAALLVAPTFAADPANSATPAPSPSGAPAPSPALTPDRPLHRRQMVRRNFQRAMLAERLGLTPEQKEQLKAKRATTAAAAKAIRDDTALTPEEKKAKLRETRQSAQAELRSLLTPEQQAKLERMKKRGHRAAHRRTSL